MVALRRHLWKMCDACGGRPSMHADHLCDVCRSVMWRRDVRASHDMRWAYRQGAYKSLLEIACVLQLGLLLGWALGRCL